MLIHSNYPCLFLSEFVKKIYTRPLTLFYALSWRVKDSRIDRLIRVLARLDMTDEQLHNLNDDKKNNDKTVKQENPFISILVNIIFPIIILEQLSKRFGDHGSLIALILALSLPLSYGAYDYIYRSKRNLISILGFLNILFTGGLALFKLQGIWFAVKEAAFPLLIGLFVLFSAFTSKPFIKILFLNPALMDVDLINQKVTEKNAHLNFSLLLKKSTIFLAGSFFLSALLNFILAKLIFMDIDPLLNSNQKGIILNQQIADMQWKSFIVIMIPSMICLFAIMFYLMNGFKKTIGLQFQDVMIKK